MMVEGDAPRPRDRPDVPAVMPSRSVDNRMNFDDYVGASAISAINKVLSANAQRIYIYDPSHKLQHPDTYDIGGTHRDKSNIGDGTEVVPELWFYFTTTQCPGKNYLLNLFVCHRQTGCFAIGISSSEELVEKKAANDKPGTVCMSELLTWQVYRSTQPNENFFIKSYSFNEQKLKTLTNNTLAIPIHIEVDNVNALNNEVIKRIKLRHECSEALTKSEKTDFVLKSTSGKEFPVHKIFLAAHSSVLRDMIKSKSSNENQAFIDLNDYELEMLIQFLYTGTIKDIHKEDCFKLLRIADRFDLKNLFALTQHAICEQIDVNNAIDIACLSEKYKLDKLQAMVFNFIKSNPKVLESNGWKNLDDVHLAKKLFQFMQSKRD